MTARMVYTRWHRDRGGKLVLRQTVLRVYPQRSRLDRAVELACDAAAVVLWFVLLLVLAVNSTGCASADGYDSPPGSSASPEAHATFSEQPQGWCCDAWDEDGKRYLECGLATLPAEHADEAGNRCYCHGVVSGDECGDASPWTPGSFCTQANLVCREAE